MKRIAALLLCLSVLCTACASAVHSPQPPTADRTQELSSQFNFGWGYRCLNEQQQKNYATIFAVVHDGMADKTHVTLSGEKRIPGVTVTLPVPLADEQQAKQLYEAFLQDNPQFFHLGGKYSFDGRQLGTTKEFTTLTLTYTMDVKQRITAAEELEAAVTALLDNLPNGTDFEKELYLHDELLSRCHYHEQASVAQSPLEEYPTAFTAYGALVEGTAVCEGYSRAMQYLLLRAGMEATVITGFDSQNQAHMWNVVRVDGKDYHLDATWNDRQNQITHTYFNLSDKAIGKTHTVENKTLGISPMSATAGQYYRYTDSYLKTTRLEQVAEFFAKRLSCGDTVIDVQLSAEAFHNTLFFVRSQAWFAETVNDALDEGVQPLAAYDFAYDETHGTITIYKK